MNGDFTKFDVEAQFLEYIKRGGVPLEDMHPVQRIETRRAFYGAWGQLLLMLRNDTADLPTEVAVWVLSKMLTQVGDFWAKEASAEKAHEEDLRQTFYEIINKAKKPK